jgi:drug/metabolite transporter (DMT)-like permease
VNTVRLALLALVWGSGYLWVELALRGGWGPVQLTVARSALGAGVLALVCLALRKRFPRGWRTWRDLGVAAFLCNAAPFVLIGFGQQTVDSGTAGVLNATTPLWALMFARDRGGAKLFGAVLGFAGVLVIFAPWETGAFAGVGALALLAAAASYAAGFAFMARRLVGRGTDTMALAAAQLAMATLLSAALLPREASFGARTTLSTVAVIVLGLACTGFTFHLSYRLIAAEGATRTAMVGYLLPVVAVGLGALVLAEQLTFRVVAGMVVVLCGVACTRDWQMDRARRITARWRARRAGDRAAAGAAGVSPVDPAVQVRRARR